MDNNKLTKKRPIEYLNDNIDLLEDLVLWPDVKYDIVEILDKVRNSYSDNLFKANKSELTRNLYLSEKPNVFYMRELQRVLNITGELIRKIDLEFKKYPDFIVEKYGREYSLHRYFLISIGEFNGFYFFAQNRIKEVSNLLQKETPKPPTTIEHPIENKQRDDFIILKMLATNEIQIIDEVFFYNNREYVHGNSLNEVINEKKGYNPSKKFTQYLNDFKNKTGEKYYIDLTDSVNNKANDKNIKRLRKFKKYLELKDIQVTNHDFKEAFEQI
jgi:hypothetical protein